MNIFCRSLFFLFICMLISCSKVQPYKLTGLRLSQFPILFTSNQNGFSHEGVNIGFQLRAMQTGDTLLFAFCIENNSNDTLNLNPAELQIETQKKIRSDVVAYDMNKLNIPPKSKDSLQFKYVPINNLTLFQRIQSAGDMDSVYFLHLNFIYKKKHLIALGERVKFGVDRFTYAKYTQKYAKDKKTVLFHIKNADELKLNLMKKIIYNGNKDHETKTVEVSNTDLLIRGLSININFYRIESSLYLKTKMINHSDVDFVVDTDQLQISENDKLLYPKVLSIVNSVKDRKNNCYPIIRGGRIELNLKYEGSTNHEFELMGKWLTYNTLNPKTLMDIIHFMPDEI